MTLLRLNKQLAHSLGIARREADELIAQGNVTVNGTPAVIGARVTPTDIVSCNGKEIKMQPVYQYMTLHKPAGYVCSRKRQGTAPTIFEILPSEYTSLKPVGRLDKDSSGILLLTNDGDFAHRMTHPRFHKTKEYEVELHTPLAPLHHQMIADFGVQLEDGKSQFQLEKLDDNGVLWRITMHEGRNRQIRRTFSSLGYEVVALHRTRFGDYTLDSLQPKEFRIING